jgi:lysophospholipase L1-like esterase
VVRFALAALVAAALSVSSAPAADPLFPLKGGDIWVMAGDSITAQHQHSNYFEAFCYARYPKLKFAFRNSGVGGHTIPTTLARFDYDIAAWKPTVVSVELGMNDSGGTLTPEFIKNMETMVGRIRAIKARPVILSASPVNDGTTMAKLTGRNVRLSEYAKALQVFSEKEQIPYADQFHALVDVWGQNKPRERQAEAIAALRAVVNDPGFPGAANAKALLAEVDQMTNPPVSMKGDPVHPQQPGQLMMAAALLKRLGADKFVSSVSIDANGKAEAKGCTVTNINVADGKIAFDRLDDCLPFPIPADARAVLPMAPEVFEMSQYLLKVTGLKEGQYVLLLDGARCARYTAKDLATGVNLTGITVEPMSKTINPMIAQMDAILNAVAQKEAVVGSWRGLSQQAHAKNADPKLMEKLAAMTKQVEEADAKIRAAAKPKSIRFEIVPAE